MNAGKQHQHAAAKYDDGLFAEWDGYSVNPRKHSRQKRHQAKIILRTILRRQYLAEPADHAEAERGQPRGSSGHRKLRLQPEAGLARLEIIAIFLAVFAVVSIIASAFGLIGEAQTAATHLLLTGGRS